MLVIILTSVSLRKENKKTSLMIIVVVLSELREWVGDVSLLSL